MRRDVGFGVLFTGIPRGMFPCSLVALMGEARLFVSSCCGIKSAYYMR